VALTRLSLKQLERLVNIARAVPLARPTQPAKSRPTRQRRLNLAQKTAVRRAYKAGMSMAALSRKYGVRKDTISKIIRDGGVAVRPQREFSAEQIAEAAELYRQGWSLARLGERYGFDPQTIRTHLVRAGVVMRGAHDWRGSR
jgi:lambda repressor-like predicted transcriptional regulator